MDQCFSDSTYFVFYSISFHCLHCYWEERFTAFCSENVDLIYCSTDANRRSGLWSEADFWQESLSDLNQFGSVMMSLYVMSLCIYCGSAGPGVCVVFSYLDQNLRFKWSSRFFAGLFYPCTSCTHLSESLSGSCILMLPNPYWWGHNHEITREYFHGNDQNRNWCFQNNKNKISPSLIKLFYAVLNNNKITE